MLEAVNVPVKARLDPIDPPALKFKIVPTVNVPRYPCVKLPDDAIRLPTVRFVRLACPAVSDPVKERFVPIDPPALKFSMVPTVSVPKYPCVMLPDDASRLPTVRFVRLPCPAVNVPKYPCVMLPDDASRLPTVRFVRLACPAVSDPVNARLVPIDPPALKFNMVPTDKVPAKACVRLA